MGTFIGNAFLGLIGGFFGVLLAGSFYEFTWAGGAIDVYLIRKSFLWMSDFFIIVPVAGGLLGGAATDKFWGPFGGGFFTSIVGFYLYVLLLGGAW